MTSKIIVNTIEGDVGVSSVTFNDTIYGNLEGNVTGEVVLDSKTTAERNAGISTSSGSLIFNSDNTKVQYYDGNNWLTFVAESDGSSAAQAAPSARYLYENKGITTDGFYYIKFTEWSSPKRVYCSMSDGGWMLWAQKLTNVSFDIRQAGFSKFTSVTGTDGLVDELTDLTTSGHVNMWPYFDGTRVIRWINNISGNTANSPGTGTKVLEAQENGLTFAREEYWNGIPGGTTCPANEYFRYDWGKVYVDSGWMNAHPTGTFGPCTGYGHLGDNQGISNYFARLGCSGCYHPEAVLFGNGGSGYYNYGNSYDDDHLGFDLEATFIDQAPSSVAANSNQLWVK